MSNQTEKQLSTKAKENLQRNAEVRQRDNKFIKLQSGEKKILQFFPEKIGQVEAEFNGKKSMRFRYTVKEEGSSNNHCDVACFRINTGLLLFIMDNNFSLLRSIYKRDRLL
jgi:hypothetical protein